ncbi:MAG: type II toxin-antitoxin system PemK/MazF family toxin [Caldilinea sp. CFX5]|nr:type II toxin-antitoxin system PemK/MazF family toxin [Caldilinea sp. CFX5]
MSLPPPLLPPPLLQRGDIVIATFPFTDLSGSKRRPALVLATTTPNADSILAFISSVMPMVVNSYELPLIPADADFAQTGLKVPSILRLNKLVTLERSLITRRIGRVSPQRLRAIDDRVIQVLNIDLQRYYQAERSRLIELMNKQGFDALLRVLQQK